MTLVVRWRAPARRITARWRGPQGIAEAVTRDPTTPIAAIIGPPGPAGLGNAGSSPIRINAALSATWTLTHALSRIPLVQVFLTSGEQVLADVSASATSISVAFASPQAGFVLAY